MSVSHVSLAEQRPDPDQAARIGVDLWDVTAHLEASGFSDSAARANGHRSAADWARRLIAGQDDLASVRRPGRSGSQWRLFGAACGRALIMLAGVTVCVSTMPRQSTEVAVFMIAAVGWLTAQVVSAALWHGLGLGARGAAVRGALVVAGLMLLVGLATWGLLGEPTVLIWVFWAFSAQLLVTLRPGWVLVSWTTAVGVAALFAWRLGEYWHALAVAGTATAVATFAALWAARAAVRGTSARLAPGTTRSVIVALVQTLAQLALLLVVFLRVGPAAFAAVALAGLAAGVLADPLFALARMGGRWIGERLTSWTPARIIVAAFGPPLVAALCAFAIVVALAVLADPYRVHLDEPLVLTAAVVTTAIIAAINALLRTGSAVGAMMFTVAASVLAGAALLVRVPTEDPWQSTPFTVTTVVLIVVATFVVAQRLSRPQAW